LESELGAHGELVVSNTSDIQSRRKELPYPANGGAPDKDGSPKI